MGRRVGIETPPGWADETDLPGACCACRRTVPLRNVVLMAFRAPAPGHGWGCLTCGLPEDGAVALLCDPCMEADAPVHDVCAGYVTDPGRVEAAPLRGRRWEHDEAAHIRDHLAAIIGRS